MNVDCDCLLCVFLVRICGCGLCVSVSLLVVLAFFVVRGCSLLCMCCVCASCLCVFCVCVVVGCVVAFCVCLCMCLCLCLLCVVVVVCCFLCVFLVFVYGLIRSLLFLGLRLLRVC